MKFVDAALMSLLALTAWVAPPTHAAPAAASGIGPSSTAQATPTAVIKEVASVRLLDPGDKEATEHEYGRYFLIKWKPGEKEQFTRMLGEVSKCAPGLITRAASGHQLHIVRVSDLPFSATTAGAFDADALTRPDAILIPDVFFENSRRLQLRCFLHELVHSADMAGQIALSKEWVRFANPIISESRCEATFGHLERRAGRTITPHNAWPSMYGCENLTEALAEYFAARAIGTEDFQFDPVFGKQFASQLMHATKKSAQFLSVYKAGSKLYNEKKYEAAIPVLLEARKLDPSVPGTDACLAACYAYTGKYDICLKYAAAALKSLKKYGVPPGEPDLIMVMEVQGLSFLNTGKLKEAIQTFDDVLAREPNNNWCRSMRARCHESQDKYADAAYDMAAIYGKTHRLIDSLLAARADNDFTIKCLNKAVEKEPSDVIVVQKRAEFYEFLGDRDLEPARQSEFYKRALDDFKVSVSLQESRKAPALIACARINLKLGEDSTAEALCNEVSEMEPFNIEAKIIKLRLLEKGGDLKTARAQYDTLKTQLQRAVPSKEDRPHAPVR